MSLSKNLKFLRTSKNITQSELCEQLGVQRSMISAYEDGRSEPKLSTLIKLAEIFHVTVDELLNRDLEVSGRKVLQQKEFKILTIAADNQDKENILMVGQKASAGYLNGYADPEYMERLPQFHLPILSSHASYRAFEITGDSMLPLVSGTLIIGAYVEHVTDIKSGKTYVLITHSEGIVYKRVFNYLVEKGKFYLVSDNTQYAPYEVDAEDILEIWEARAFISTNFPQPKDREKPVTLEEISQMIVELKNDIQKIKK
jgi:transcriptional regulator with XRE-family HTH domain